MWINRLISSVLLNSMYNYYVLLWWKLLKSTACFRSTYRAYVFDQPVKLLKPLLGYFGFTPLAVVQFLFTCFIDLLDPNGHKLKKNNLFASCSRLEVQRQRLYIQRVITHSPITLRLGSLNLHVLQTMGGHQKPTAARDTIHPSQDHPNRSKQPKHRNASERKWRADLKH